MGIGAFRRRHYRFHGATSEYEPVYLYPIADQSGIQGDPYSLNLSVSGSATPFVYAAVGLPDGMSISDGLISGTLTADAGTYEVTVTVTDTEGSQSSQSFSWVVVVISNYNSISWSDTFVSTNNFANGDYSIVSQDNYGVVYNSGGIGPDGEIVVGAICSSDAVRDRDVAFEDWQYNPSGEIYQYQSNIFEYLGREYFEVEWYQDAGSITPLDDPYTLTDSQGEVVGYNVNTFTVTTRYISAHKWFDPELHGTTSTNPQDPSPYTRRDFTIVIGWMRDGDPSTHLLLTISQSTDADTEPTASVSLNGTVIDSFAWQDMNSSFPGEPIYATIGIAGTVAGYTEFHVPNEWSSPFSWNVLLGNSGGGLSSIATGSLSADDINSLAHASPYTKVIGSTNSDANQPAITTWDWSTAAAPMA